ncbi:MAG: VOC family protein, partial [Panacagrimonas sp.]
MDAPDAAMPQAAGFKRMVPSKLAHYVIRVKRWEAMLQWYRTMFLLETSFEAPVIAFLTYDEEHHRIAFLNTAHLPAPAGKQTGIDHVAFCYENLESLLLNWERLKAQGIEPFWCINHGMSTSMYYRDPDGNEIELQVDNFPTMDECKAWFSSEAFAANPIGVDFDPAALLAKLRGGVLEADLLKQGAAPVPKDRQYVYTTLLPPRMVDMKEGRRRDCEALAYAYLEYADQWRAEDLAGLFTEDGVLDRLGNLIVGRQAIAAFIANRPREFWQRHRGSGFTFAPDAAGD